MSRKYIKEEYSIANSTCENSLTSLCDSINKIARELDNYYEKSKDKLISESFNILFNKLQDRIELLKNMSNSLNELLNNMKSCNNKVISAMGSEEEISDKSLDEINKELEILRFTYNVTKAKLNTIDIGGNQSVNCKKIGNNLSAIASKTNDLAKRKEEIENILLNTSKADKSGAASVSSTLNTVLTIDSK